MKKYKKDISYLYGAVVCLCADVKDLYKKITNNKGEAIFTNDDIDMNIQVCANELSNLIYDLNYHSVKLETLKIIGDNYDK